MKKYYKPLKCIDDINGKITLKITKRVQHNMLYFGVSSRWENAESERPAMSQRVKLAML